MRLLFCIVVALPSSLWAQAEPSISHLWSDFLNSDYAHAEPAMRFPFENCFRQAAREFELPLNLLLAVARGESDFQPRAVSSANARGIMQILWPVTAHHLGIYREALLFEPCTNIRAGARYLRELLDRYDGDLHLALAAYNFGPNRIEVNAISIPEKAESYSRYIFRHLQYVADLTNERESSATDYAEERKLVLIEFEHPRLAERFISNLTQNAARVRLDVFKTYFNRYKVVLLFASDSELNQSRIALGRAGFRLEEPYEFL